jgi:hypothetical protein
MFGTSRGESTDRLRRQVDAGDDRQVVEHDLDVDGLGDRAQVVQRLVEGRGS